jgi:predicted metal-dependent phosphoesterase TrpH
VVKWRILTDKNLGAMPVVDLHTHSLCSDGALTPSDLVARAHAAGVQVLALTDHDSVAGVPEAETAARVCGMTLLPGLELSTLWRGFSIHLVGLGVDIHHPGLMAGLALQASARGERAKAIAERLEKARKPGAYAAALALAGGDPDRISRTHFAQWLVETGAVSSMQGAFDKYLGNGKSADVPMPWIDLPTAVSLIRDAGGTAVLAHPGRYPLTRTKLRTVIGLFKEAGGEALEVATATEKPDVVRYLGQLCTQFDLEASQGSDFHGPHIPWIQLGRFPELPAECRPVWRRWIPEERAV